MIRNARLKVGRFCGHIRALFEPCWESVITLIFGQIIVQKWGNFVFFGNCHQVVVFLSHSPIFACFVGFAGVHHQQSGVRLVFKTG